MPKYDGVETYELSLVQGARYQRDLRWTRDGAPLPLNGYQFRGQVRQKEQRTSALLLDLTPHLTLSDDGTTLHIDVPATVTADLPERSFKESSSWDIFLWPVGHPELANLLIEGPATLDPSATNMGDA